MPAVTFEFQGQLRSFILMWPSDFAVHWGDLHLLIGLHAEYEKAELFMQELEIEALMAGDLTLPDGTSIGGPQKVVAIVPRALSLSDQEQGQWNAGVMGPQGRMMDMDDVQFIAECVGVANEALWGEYLSQTGQSAVVPVAARAPVPVLGIPGAPPIAVPPVVLPPQFIPRPIVPFYERGRILVAGKAAGGQLAFRFQSEIQDPTRVLPASIASRDLVPDLVAVAGSSTGGYAYWQEGPSLPNPAFPNAGLVAWHPGTVTSSVVQFQGSADTWVSQFGGVGQDNRDAVNYRMGGDGDGFFRYDLAPGPTDPTAPVPDTTQFGLGTWVDAIAPSVPPVLILPTAEAPFTTWTWIAPPVVGPFGFGLPSPRITVHPKSVTYVLHELQSAIGSEDGPTTANLWPSTFRTAPRITAPQPWRTPPDTFSATAIAWRILLEGPWPGP